MKLFLYYAFCSVKNQIKKLCKTWFLIFILVCLLFGAVVGVAGAYLDEKFGEEPPVTEESLPEDEEIVWTDEDILEIKGYAEPAFMILTVVILFFSILTADKSGGAIFLMPDVNLLFPSPRKPQSVLLFRLMSKIAVSVLASLYLLIQIPALASGLGMSPWVAVFALISWIFILVYQNLINVLVYTATSTHERFKKFVRPAAFVFLIIFIIPYLVFYLKTNDYFKAIKMAFGGPVLRFFPIVGWIKACVGFAVSGNYIAATLMLLLLAVAAAALAYLVWNIKADFYEEAMARAEETRATLESVETGVAAKREKDRNDKILRDGMSRGSGASVFFHKAMYNRRRFSHLGIFTKTAETYFAIAVLVSSLLAFVVKTDSFLPIGLGLSAIVFFRSLGNPLAEDMDKVYFVTIPEGAHEKVFWSLLSGSVACILDTLPAVLVSALIMRASPLEVIGFYLLAVCVDFYSSNVMLFIEFSLPSSISLQIKQMISVLFIYFGLLPIAAVLFVGAILELFNIFIFVAAGAALAIGAFIFIFTPLFLERGRR